MARFLHKRDRAFFFARAASSSGPPQPRLACPLRCGAGLRARDEGAFAQGRDE
jgi:hypothetical protein